NLRLCRNDPSRIAHHDSRCGETEMIGEDEKVARFIPDRRWIKDRGKPTARVQSAAFTPMQNTECLKGPRWETSVSRHNDGGEDWLWQTGMAFVSRLPGNRNLHGRADLATNELPTIRQNVDAARLVTILADPTADN